MRFFTWLLVAAAILVLVFVIIFKGPSGSTPKTPVINLNSYATTNAVAQLTIDGPVNSDKEHQQVQISVDNTTTQFEILKGYQGSVATNKTFANNTDSFAAFLHALNVAGFIKGNTDPKLADDRGYCPDGDRYVFELTEGDKTIVHFWSTECGSQGTYGGDTQQTLDLFQNQVPGYNDLTDNVNI